MTEVPEAPPGPLPEPVRLRIVALASDALPSVPQLPPSLRKVAAFAPARRARLGGTQISVALEGDDDFRESVGVQVSAAVPELSAAVAGGTAPATADPVEVAALAWLLRPDGWSELVVAASRETQARQDAALSEQDASELERLRERLAGAETATRELRAHHKEQIEAIKAENVTLRRKLGELRVQEKAAAENAAADVKELTRLRAELEAARSASDIEIRRLRGQLASLQEAVSAARRDVRADRDDTTLRARLLLDTLLDAATGLRRELALPTVSGAPADRIEGTLAEQGVRTPSAAGALGPSSPALLEQYLALPRPRLIIDGYNVSKEAWPSSSLEAQRTRLLNGVAPLVARSGAETTVVFDAAASKSRPLVNPPRGVKVLFSPEGVIADDVIRELVDAEPRGRVVVVVTSDREVASDVLKAGARAIDAEALVTVLSRSG